MRGTQPHRRHYPILDSLGTIPDLLLNTPAPRRTYVVDGDVQLGVSDIAARAGGLRSHLAGLGVGPGDIVTVQLPNWWQTIAVAHAVWALGAVVNPVTPIYRSRELATILELSRPRVVVVPSEFRGFDYPAMISHARTEAGTETEVLRLDRDAWHYGEADLSPAPMSPDDIAVLMYTSGTTGRPKGVLHSHRTLLAESRSIAQVFGLAGDRVFMPSPLTHITGLEYGVLMPLQIDGDVVLLDRWDPEGAAGIVENRQCTTIVAATPFLRGLTDSYHRRGHQSSLRSFVCGGADIPEALVRRAESVLGLKVARTYGSTELPTLCTVPPELTGGERYTTEGPVIGEARARIAAGTGELEVHGPELFLGYLDPADNVTAFTDDGWFRTGDLATIDDRGNVRILGRLKDLIIRGGENISAKEVEDLLLELPGVADVAVVGVPDDTLGERACAVIVAHDSAPDLEAITAHLRAAGLATQKFPEHLVTVTALPRTASGKIQKFRVRQSAIRLLAEQALESGLSEDSAGTTAR